MRRAKAARDAEFGGVEVGANSVSEFDEEGCVEAKRGESVGEGGREHETAGAGG